MKSVLLLSICLALFGCKEDDIQMKIFFFDHGKITEVQSTDSDLNDIKNTLYELFKNTTEMMRLHVDEERINNIKENETAVEFEFKDKIKIESKEFGEFEVDKIFIPFSGDFVGSENDPIITIFISEDGYLSGPFRNSDVYSNLMKLKELIEGNN